MRKLTQELAIEETDLHRKEDCKRYDECLDIASEAYWPSFSCSQCKSYERNPESHIEAELLHVVASRKEIAVREPVKVGLSHEEKKKASKDLKVMRENVFKNTVRIIKSREDETKNEN